MFYKLPFWTGAALGAGLVWLLNQRRVKEGLKHGKDYVSDKLDQGVATAKAVKSCVAERRDGVAATEAAVAEPATDPGMGETPAST